MQNHGVAAPQGNVTLEVIRGGGQRTPIPASRPHLVPAPSTKRLLARALPDDVSPHHINMWRLRNLPNILRGFRRITAARLFNLPHFYGALSLAVIRADGSIENYGLVSLRVVTTTGVNFIVDAFQNLTELENFKYHGLGTGTNAEASSDTALQTELTTQYNPDNTRATGSLTEGASANIFRTVGTNTVDATAAVTEHGIFTQAATGGGTLLDRSVFSVINLASGDAIQSTYDLTVNAGG